MLFVCAVLTAQAAQADGISVSQSLDRFSIPFEDSVHFEIVLKWNGPQSAYLFTKPLNPTFDRLKARGVTTSVSSTGSGSDEITTKRFSFTLVPTSSGLGSIDPVIISYITWPDSIPGELVTEAMTVQIAELLPPVEGHGGVSVWVLILVALVVVVSAAFAFVRWKKGRTPKEIEKTPVQQFLEQLTVLKQESESEFKKFQAGLYKLLVEFLTAKYAINPDGAADDEIEKLLEPTDLNEHQKRQISQWLVQARRDKFRPVVAAPGETIRLETEIRRFFEKLKP
ncbi:MAG: hypothetical protein ACE5K8_02550 [Candidatus Zixiibacteriota bacterium]